MTIDELQVLITANTNNLRKEIDKTNSVIKGLKKNADKQSKGVTTAFSKLKTGIVALGIGKVIKDSIQSGMEAIESDNLFSVSLGKHAKEVYDWSTEVSNALGLNAVEIRKNTGVIYNMTSSMGLAEKQALTMSKGVTLLANDMASFYNLNTDEAFNKIRAGITGETEPLKALGILVDENTIKQVAYSEGIATTGSELTQQQKVLARYVAILKQTGNAQGDLARTLDSPANLFRRLGAEIKNCGTILGSIFIPIIQNVVPYIIAFVKVISNALSSVASFLGIKTNGLSSETESASNNIGSLADSMGDAESSAKKMKQTLAGFDEITNLNANNDSESDSATSGGGLNFDLSEYDAGLSGIDDKVAEITEKMQKRLTPILTLVSAIGTGFLAWKVSDSILSTLDLIKLKLKTLTKTQKITLGVTLAITGLVLEGTAIANAVTNGLDSFNFGEMVIGSGGLISGGAMIGKALGSSIIGGGIGAIIGGIPMLITGIYDAVVNGLNWLNGVLIPLGSSMGGAGIGAIIGSLGGPIGTGIGALIGLAIGLITDFGIWLAQHWKEVKTGVVNFFMNTIPEAWNQFTNWLSGAWSNFTTWLGEVPSKLGYMLGQALGTVVLFFQSVITNLTTFFTVTIPQKWNEFTTWLSNAWTNIVNWAKQIPSKLYTFFTVTIPEKFNELIEYVKGLPEKFLEFGKNIVQGILDGITEGWTTLKQKWSEFIDGFVQGFKDKLGIHSPSTVFAEMGGNITEGIEQGIGDGNGAFDGLNVLSAESVENMKMAWLNIATWFKDNVTSPLEGVFETFSSNMTNIFQGITAMIKGEILTSVSMMNILIDSLQIAMNSIVKSVNAIIRSINATAEETGIYLPYAQTQKLERVPIPKLARGGLIDRPTVAMIGEAGKEAVIPLENNTGWLDKLASKFAVMVTEMNDGSNSNNSFTSNLIVNGRLLASTTIEDFNNEAIRRGYKPLLAT